MMNLDWSLYTDLYQLTMAQGYLESGKAEQQATFTMHFRDYPFKGGYAVACGMTQLVEMLEEYSFRDDDIEYLRSIPAPAGGAMFSEGFLDYLSKMRLSLDIDAMPEGTIAFPGEPILRVQGPIMQCQMIETMLLNCVSFQTLLATKAARVCRAAGGRPVTEFGLRRAQGTGSLWASRAAVVGGCVGTSNVLAGKMFNIPVSGTHAHSWVMSFDSELEAFREYARIFPKNCSLLVDTYDVEAGVRNAITVAHELAARGEHLSAIRIDSGDLAWLSKMARRMLDEAGLEGVKIMLTNDLDEYTITSILDEGAPVDMWGVGTKLATAFDQPTLGGVYKLSAVRDSVDDEWQACLKVSESVCKTSIPGVLDVRRYYNDDGKIAGDMVFDINQPVNEDEVIVDPVDALRQKRLRGRKCKTLFVPLMRDGKAAGGVKVSAMEARKLAIEGQQELDETQLRMLNPHTYPVGYEEGLYKRRNALVAELRDIDVDRRG